MQEPLSATLTVLARQSSKHAWNKYIHQLDVACQLDRDDTFCIEATVHHLADISLAPAMDWKPGRDFRDAQGKPAEAPFCTKQMASNGKSITRRSCGCSSRA